MVTEREIDKRGSKSKGDGLPVPARHVITLFVKEQQVDGS